MATLNIRWIDEEGNPHSELISSESEFSALNDDVDFSEVEGRQYRSIAGKPRRKSCLTQRMYASIP